MLWSKRAKMIGLSNCLLTLCIILFSVIFTAADAAQPERASQNTKDNTIFDILHMANEANENIYTYLKWFPTGNTSRATNFPDFFAGSYFDKDGKLAVMLTDNSPEIRQALTDAAGNSAVRFESATYSYEELTQMANVIYEKIKENQLSKKDGTHQPNICDDIRYAMLLDEQNMIAVYIHNLTEEKMRAFEDEILDSGAIILRNTNDSFHYLDLQLGVQT